MKNKYVYFFGNNHAEGKASMTNLLGGKGANLAEMVNLKIPVPPGFTITTEACVYYMKHGQLPPGCKMQIKQALKKIETILNQKFGDNKNPLLVSIRSGARCSMPGMMETVLNIGLTDNTIVGLINKTQNKKFAFDSYRRLMMMYSDVVMDESTTPYSKSFRVLLEEKLSEIKKKNNIIQDVDLNEEHLQNLCSIYKQLIHKSFKVEFPQKPMDQLWRGIEAVFKSWNGKRAVEYRKIEHIPDSWGTAVNVQAMVFGNLGNDSATGVAFTRNPSTGERKFFGEWLPNAQGEDVVAGIRTPLPINNHKDSLEDAFPNLYQQLNTIQKKLENHYSDMLDIEFTIQKNKLWLLQNRVGKRNGPAAIKIAVDMLNERKITKKTALNRIKNQHINELLLPIIEPKEEAKQTPVAFGLPAGPGAASGKIIFSSEKASELGDKKEKIILVREETSPEDVAGMFASQAILTERGGMTSHAALVARGWGKCCIVGCSAISINYNKKTLKINNKTYKEYDWLTLNGTTGAIYKGKISLIQKDLKKYSYYKSLMTICNKTNRMLIRTNADRQDDAINAKNMGAKGIGLCRTEHMFFNASRIKIVRKMILSTTPDEKSKYIQKLLPYQEGDFYKILKAMSPHPVTIRLLDPPLHEFLPQQSAQINELATELKLSSSGLRKKINQLHEINPMLGHRGCRLGITYPEITVMQTTAIINAALKLKKENYKIKPEIMIPLVGTEKEFINQKKIIVNTANSLFKKQLTKIPYTIGTMIELPRACMIADKIAKHADFISFGTNDLTQTTFGYSRDDIGSFLPNYINKNILSHDPFASIDINGVGQLITIAIKKAKKNNPNIKIGICGEHGGDPKSIHFFNKMKFDYISCSPFRIPGAYLAVAQSTL